VRGTEGHGSGLQGQGQEAVVASAQSLGIEHSEPAIWGLCMLRVQLWNSTFQWVCKIQVLGTQGLCVLFLLNLHCLVLVAVTSVSFVQCPPNSQHRFFPLPSTSAWKRGVHLQCVPSATPQCAMVWRAQQGLRLPFASYVEKCAFSQMLFMHCAHME
jgi:hypothetical protein